jgi:hypothetical protein
MTRLSLFEIKEQAQAQLNDIMPGKVTVSLDKNPATGKNELVGYYQERGRVNFKREGLMGSWDCWNNCLDLFVSYFKNRKDYIMASELMQELAFKNNIHPQTYPMFAKEMAKEMGLYMD